MYKFNEIKTVHFEITSLCQAKCPMCARNHHGGLPNPLLKESDINLDFFKSFMTIDFVKQLESISLCGNFGDPILHKDLLEIVEYVATANPNIKIDLHSNASARTTAWWESLAKVMPRRHVVHFGIDGLEDTHALYRIGTDFNKIIENAKAFIAAGGVAQWNFITFKHNEHQQEICRQMAKDLGFESFQEKQTSRFIGERQFDVFDKNGNITHKLEEPTERKIVFLDRKTVENYKEVVKTATIICEVEDHKSIYIDAQGHVWPCCFTAGVPYLYSAPTQLLANFKDDSRATLKVVIDQLGGMDGINLRNRTIQEIVDSAEWQTIWDQAFKDNSVLICARVCGKFPEAKISQCRDQFLELENFNE